MSNLQIEKTQPTAFYRWLILIFISLAMFGNYYIYDSIAPIADLLKAARDITDEDIGLLYSSYSIAAIIVLLGGGYIIDKFGTKISLFAFALICTLSAFITAFAPDQNVMLVGRFLLGVGSEPLIVAVTTSLAKWFKGKELSFAFGLNLTIARLGSVAADNSPTWAKSYYGDWQSPLFIAIALAIICLMATIAYWILESNAEKKFALGERSEIDKLDFKNLFKFGLSFWLIVGLCVTFYSAIFPFRTFAIKYFMEAHGTEREFAGMLNSILPFSAMIATPLFGLLVDRIGKRALLMAIGSFLLIPTYLLMTYTNISLFIPIAMMGISFSLIPAVMWPSVAYIVEEKRLGSAYALMTLIQQVGLAGMNWIIGSANDFSNASLHNPTGYDLGMWIFTSLGFFGLLFAYFLRRSEVKADGHGLELKKN
ncbi:MAG: major facilitator superfamily domain-containing protein 1 [Ignavibacteria bacterium]|nr:major facilitator superfamily domain-containing protein 1 [Ignavibacteria bacterium]